MNIKYKIYIIKKECLFGLLHHIRWTHNRYVLFYIFFNNMWIVIISLSFQRKFFIFAYQVCICLNWLTINKKKEIRNNLISFYLSLFEIRTRKFSVWFWKSFESWKKAMNGKRCHENMREVCGERVGEEGEDD